MGFFKISFFGALLEVKVKKKVIIQLCVISEFNTVLHYRTI